MENFDVIPQLLYFIATQFKVKLPAAFSYVSTRMMFAALTTLLITVVLGPAMIRQLHRWRTKQSIRVEGYCPTVLMENHANKKETPSMGGGLILVSMLISLLCWMDLSAPFTWILALTTLWFGITGGIDDYLKRKKKNWKGLSARSKLLLQTGFVALLALYLYYPDFAHLFMRESNISMPCVKMHVDHRMQLLSFQEYMGQYYIPFLKNPLFTLTGLGLILAPLCSWLTITGAANAVNLTDGLDGLASGCLVLAASVLGICAFLSNNIEIARYLNILYIEESGEIAVYLFALAGACLGFLWYNGHPAQVFMGDIGSLPLGAILGVSAVLLRREVLLALVGGIFVVEALSVIVQVSSYKLRNKKRIFLCTPLHHHFECKGWPEIKVVLRFWIIGIVLAVIGLASLKLQ